MHKAAALHVKLIDTAVLINHAYSLQLLLLITICFVGTVPALFLIAVNFTKHANEHTKLDILFTLWVFSSLVAIVILVCTTNFLCEKVGIIGKPKNNLFYKKCFCFKANKCPKILHKISNKSDTQLQDAVRIVLYHILKY